MAPIARFPLGWCTSRSGWTPVAGARTLNLGSPNEYFAVHRLIEKEHWRPAYLPASDWPRQVASDAIVDPSAQVRGCSSIGAGCRVGAGAIIEDSILWTGAQIASRAHLK